MALWEVNEIGKTICYFLAVIFFKDSSNKKKENAQDIISKWFHILIIIKV